MTRLKKAYTPPVLENIIIDNNISMMMSSIPDPGTGEPESPWRSTEPTQASTFQKEVFSSTTAQSFDSPFSY